MLTQTRVGAADFSGRVPKHRATLRTLLPPPRTILSAAGGAGTEMAFTGAFPDGVSTTPGLLLNHFSPTCKLSREVTWIY